MEKITIVLILFLTMGNCQEKTQELIFNSNEYQKFAKEEVIKRYKLTNTFFNKYPDIYEANKLIPFQYNLDSIAYVSTPIYTFKGHKTFNCGDNVIDYIQFENNPKYQYVNLEVDESYIGTTKITPLDSLPEFESATPFDFMDYILIIDNQDVPILGSDINVYAYKEKLEKEYFTFYLEGILGLFIIKDEKVYFVKMVNNNTDSNWNDLGKYLEKITPEFVEINQYFYQNYNPEEINDIMQGKIEYSNKSAKKCTEKTINKIVKTKIILKNKY
ncbi:hypothetical protein [Cellulophaga tyrosinoxydans]|nr:hypothetical protein [Cellulophaga tyrosinoxydans]